MSCHVNFNLNTRIHATYIGYLLGYTTVQHITVLLKKNGTTWKKFNEFLKNFYLFSVYTVIDKFGPITSFLATF